MATKMQFGAILVALAIAASFYSASIGFGLASDAGSQAIPAAQVSLVLAECNTGYYLEQWEQGKITLSELMQKFEAKKAGKAC